MNQIRYNYLLSSIKSLSEKYADLLNEMQDKPISEVNNYFMDFNSRKKSPEEVLNKVFGYTTFRPLQKTVIQNVLDGRDTLAIMPTGGGKSLCYEIPALILEGLTVVISPLISLMQDQVTQLKATGVPAAFLNSTLEWEEYKSICDEVREGKIKLLYISPESLNTERINNLLHSENVNLQLLTIDESHIISQWGHDFRPDYLEIASIREQFPNAVCLALTATATELVRKDIIRCLRMENPAVLISSFNRPNIYLQVEKKNNSFDQILNFINSHEGESGIIYCFSRKNVDQLTDKLIAKGINAINYHAGLTDEVRAKNQNDFIQDKVDVMVATLAFGMGINKPDVRYVIHSDMPKSIEQYYQEIGRAGRDGLNATALLLYSPGDINKIRYFFNEAQDTSNSERLLQSMIKYAEGRNCRRNILLSYFGENFLETEKTDCCCDICTRGPLQEKDVTVPAQKLMSTIWRTQERYGITYITDILLGSKNAKIMERGHNNLSTYGIGKDLSKDDWIELNNSLIENGYLFKDMEYGVLYITEFGREALKQRKEIFLPVELYGSAKNQKQAKEKIRKSSQNTISNSSEDQELCDQIRQWRKKLAVENNVPPYIIFGDKTLYDIASKKPSNLLELKNCYGIGEAKLEAFGQTLLAFLKSKYL